MTSKKKTTSNKKPTRSKKPKETKKATTAKADKGQSAVKSDSNKVSDDDGRKTNNLSRVNRIRKANADEIRKKFKAKEYIKQLEQSMERLEAIINNLNIANQIKAKLTKKERDKLTLVKNQIDVLMMQRDTIRVQIDLNLRRLKYCVPELKAMELSDPSGNSPLAGLSELMREIAND